MKKTGFRRGEALRRAGWAGGGYLSAQIQGADSVFRRTACLHPRLRVSAGLNFVVIALSKSVDVGRDHLIHRKRSPFPYEGKALTRLKLRHDFPGPAKQFPNSRRAKRCRAARRGEAHRRHGNGCRLSRGSVGWVGGVYPSTPLPARTAASGGHCAYTRACASAPGLILR